MDALTASGSRQSFRDAGGQGAIVFDPERLPQADAALFDPRSYGARALPVRGRGGRGAAWFVDLAGRAAVLRHYRRGGWMALASEDRYLWQGERRARSMREFALMQGLRGLGLPVPAPIAAFYQRRGASYRAAILVERIADASSFAQAVARSPGGAPWRAVGQAIGRCHRRGAHHADLNANNVLIDGHGEAWLIDWDKGCVEAGAGAWCDAVLQRLRRSLAKECPAVSDADLTHGMELVRAAHDQAMAP